MCRIVFQMILFAAVAVTNGIQPEAAVLNNGFQPQGAPFAPATA
jgi:hypothetical protein